MLSRIGFASLRQGRTMMMTRAAFMAPSQKMGYLKDLGLDNDALIARGDEPQKAGEVDLWKA